jgi:RNA polymerase sigma-70 factor (ECF subfamily)
VVLANPDLIDNARRGDPAAWEELVRQHQEGVFRLAYLHLEDAAEAEDIAQETFLRAFRSLHRYDPARPLRPWLLTIAANLARNRRRSLGRYRAALQRLLRAEPQPSGRLTHEPAGLNEKQRAQGLWQAVRELGWSDRQVIQLRYYLQLPVSETAQALGVAEGTVKSRLNRALGRLHRMIERDFPWLKEEIGG